MKNKEKIHFSIDGEESLRTLCNKYYTSNSAITGTVKKVTCKLCLKRFTNTSQRIGQLNEKI